MVTLSMRHLIRTLFAVALIALGLQSTHAQADQGFIISQSYYLDKTNELTYDEAKSLTFTPYQRMLTGGFNKGAYWIKLELRATTQDSVLKIRPPFINEITLYDPASNHGPRSNGSNYPIDAADIDANSLNFLIPPSTENRSVYLRVKSVSSYVLYIEAMSLIEFERDERSDNLIYTGYLMLTLILAVWMFVTWLIYREPVIGLFALQQFVAVLHTFSRVGFSRTFFDQYISDVLISQISNGIVVVYPFVGIVVNKFLLQEYGLKRFFRIIFYVLLSVSLVIISLYLIGQQQFALSLNAPMVMFAMVWFWVCATWGIEASKSVESSYAVQIKAIRFYYSFNLLLWIVALFPLLGYLSTGTFVLHSLLVYNITSSLFFVALLQYRARWLLRNEVARASTLEAQATQERQRREEQGMLMAMLSHEIKTPLSVLKLVMDEKVAGSDLEGHANRAVNNINFIVNRCLQLGKLDAKAIRLNPTSFSAKDFVSALLQDIQGASRVLTDIPDSLVLNADREILRLVLNNLIENALKYSDPAQMVQLNMLMHSQEMGCRVVIEVRNKVGVLGVPDPDQVFKKYYRNTQATKVTGSGLGLFLVHELVGVMGGEVSYTNENDEVIFSIWIPT